MQLKKNKNLSEKVGGFTLIEMILVMLIFVLLVGASFLNLFGKKSETDLTATTNQIVAVVREAQNRAINQDQGSNWGVYFQNNTSSRSFYALYSGLAYSATSAVEYYSLPVSLGFGNPAVGSSTDANFSQILGLPATSSYVNIYLLITPQSSSTINISAKGVITY